MLDLGEDGKRRGVLVLENSIISFIPNLPSSEEEKGCKSLAFRHEHPPILKG